MLKDDALAAFTDAMLENRTMELTDDLHDLEGVVRRLNQAIQPNRLPDATFRARLTQRLNEEWGQMERQQRVRHIQNQRMLRYVAAAAALLLVATAAILLATNTRVQGSAAGDDPNWLVLFMVALVAVGATVTFYVWKNRRR